MRKGQQHLPRTRIRRIQGRHTTSFLLLASCCACLVLNPKIHFLASAFKLSSLGSIITGKKEDREKKEPWQDAGDSLSPKEKLLKKYGEEGYRRLVAEALDEDIPTSSDAASSPSSTEEKPLEYGLDISFPMQHDVSTNYAWLPHNVDPKKKTPKEFKDMPVQPLGDKQSFYEKLIDGCAEFYGDKGEYCYNNEETRINHNLQQPQSMQNYTDIGFKKIRAPAKLFEMLTEFWMTNKDDDYKEAWPPGNTYTNHWESPTYMVSVDDEELIGGGDDLRGRIWDAASETIQQWTGEDLTPCSLYGIRIYKEGSVLAPHVDRLPLVSSAIINVAQDVDEEWPLEVIAHDGKAYNITMQPGDMVLYESHSVMHGRPFPLKGRYYANVFIHFEPTGHSLRHEEKMHQYDAEELYTLALEEEDYEDYEDEELPHYIIEGSPEADRWRQKFSNTLPKIKTVPSEGITLAHTTAAEGNLAKLKALAKDDKDILFSVDENGWQPLHEAVRGGHTYVVEYLLKQGADVNARTGHGKGGSALWWAKKTLDDDHPTVVLLVKNGGVAIAPLK